MTNAQVAIPILTSIAELAGRYDAWLCDIWGVMHNGERPFSDAVQACSNFREGGGVITLISNSPRPCFSVARQLAEIGVPEGCYDAIVTSGDSTRQALAEKQGQPMFHLGPARDTALFEGLDIRLAGLEHARFVLCSGLYDDHTETPDDYGDLLADMKGRGLLMICANPDIQVEKGERLIYCAGALAAAYKSLGGEVVYTGKPHPPIYKLALEKISEAKGADVPRERILCIGDGVNTDMAGAAASGMDALFVTSALHMKSVNDDTPLDQAALVALFPEGTAKPLAVQKRLKW